MRSDTATAAPRSTGGQAIRPNLQSGGHIKAQAAVTATLTATSADDDNTRRPVTEVPWPRWSSQLGPARIF